MAKRKQTIAAAFIRQEKPKTQTVTVTLLKQPKPKTQTVKVTVLKEAAALLSKRGVQARKKMFTREQRSEMARQAVLTRWRKRKTKPDAKPAWYGLVELPDIVDRFDSAGKPKPLGEPELLKWSRDKEELYDQMRAMTAHPLPDRNLQIIELSYDPTRFTIQRDYKPDVAMQLKALRVVLDHPDEEDGRS
jgi:hypothetical protein